MTATLGERATLAHGYTMAEIDRLTRVSVKTYRYSLLSLDQDDRWEAAWFAIVELLYDSTEPPTPFELLCAGERGIRTAMNENFSFRGYNPKLGTEGPHFEKFWTHIVAPRPDFTERLAERLALPAVLALLTADEYDALAALSVYDHQRRAADSLRIGLSTFQARIKRARDKIDAAWFEHETPPSRSLGNDVACRYGHARAEHSYREETHGRRVCRICSRNSVRRTQARKVS